MIVLDKEYPAALTSIRELHTDLRACLTRLNYNDSDQDSFMLSAAEILTNALTHTKTPTSSFKVELHIQGPKLHFTLMDDGAPFEDFYLMHQ